MKRGREIEKSEFVLDEFHLEKYKKKALYGIEEREKEEKQLEEWLKERKKESEKRVCKFCTCRKNEFAANGMEQKKCGPDVKVESLCKKWRRHAEFVKKTEKRS